MLFKYKSLIASIFAIVFIIYIILSLSQIRVMNRQILTKQSSISENLNKYIQAQSDNWIYNIPQNTKSKLVDLLKIYSATDKNGPIKLIRHGRQNDGGYVVPEKAFLKSDALIGYGIADDSSFEEMFSEKYNKPSYGFDCGVQSVTSTNKLFTFISECVASDNFVYDHQQSSQKISTFTQQINSLGLEQKKIFVKMDIEGAEYEALGDILNHSNDITGIVLELHMPNRAMLEKAIILLSAMQKDFLLVHIHGNNYGEPILASENIKGSMPLFLELTFINKNLADHYSISHDQKHPTTLDMPCNSNKKDSEFEILLNQND